MANARARERKRNAILRKAGKPPLSKEEARQEAARKKKVEGGARWKQALREALLHSRKVTSSLDRAAIKHPSDAALPYAHGSLWKTIRAIERSDFCVWEIAEGLELTDMESAMIAQAVAPPLAAMARHLPSPVVHTRESQQPA
jgi:hypothetical protein